MQRVAMVAPPPPLILWPPSPAGLLELTLSVVGRESARVHITEKSPKFPRYEVQGVLPEQLARHPLSVKEKVGFLWAGKEKQKRIRTRPPAVLRPLSPTLSNPPHPIPSCTSGLGESCCNLC